MDILLWIIKSSYKLLFTKGLGIICWYIYLPILGKQIIYVIKWRARDRANMFFGEMDGVNKINSEF